MRVSSVRVVAKSGEHAPLAVHERSVRERRDARFDSNPTLSSPKIIIAQSKTRRRTQQRWRALGRRLGIDRVRIIVAAASYRSRFDLVFSFVMCFSHSTAETNQFDKRIHLHARNTAPPVGSTGATPPTPPPLPPDANELAVSEVGRRTLSRRLCVASRRADIMFTPAIRYFDTRDEPPMNRFAFIANRNVRIRSSRQVRAEAERLRRNVAKPDKLSYVSFLSDTLS